MEQQGFSQQHVTLQPPPGGEQDDGLADVYFFMSGMIFFVLLCFLISLAFYRTRR